MLVLLVLFYSCTVNVEIKILYLVICNIFSMPTVVRLPMQTVYNCKLLTIKWITIGLSLFSSFSNQDAALSPYTFMLYGRSWQSVDRFVWIFTSTTVFARRQSNVSVLQESPQHYSIYNRDYLSVFRWISVNLDCFWYVLCYMLA